MSQPPSDHYANDARESAERIRTHARATLDHARSITERLESGHEATLADSNSLAEREQTLGQHEEQLQAIRRGLNDEGLDSGYLDGIEADVLRALEVVRNTREALGQPG